MKVLRLSALRTGSLQLPPSPQRNILLEAESTPGPRCGWRNDVNEKFQWHHRESNPQSSSSNNCATACSQPIYIVPYLLWWTTVMVRRWARSRYLMAVLIRITVNQGFPDLLGQNFWASKIHMKPPKGLESKTYLLTPWSRVILEKLTSKLCSYSRNSPHVIEPEGSWTYSQQPSTCPYPEPKQSNPYPIPFLNIHFNIILPSMPCSANRFLSLGFPHQNPARTSSLPHTCHTSRPSHFSWLDHPNNIWWATQIIKFLVTQSSPLPC